MNTDEIIATLVNRRKALGLTQARLAERAGISRCTLLDLEAGRHDIGLRKLLRLLDTTGLTLLLKEGRDRPTESEVAVLFKNDDE